MKEERCFIILLYVERPEGSRDPGLFFDQTFETVRSFSYPNTAARGAGARTGMALPVA